MLQINTNSLNSRKKVEIDGHPYTVRRYGAGEQLTLNKMQRESNKLAPRLSQADVTEAEIEKAEKLSVKLIDIFAGLFDDGGDGSKSRKLVESLSPDEVSELFMQIFDDGQEAES